MPETVVIGAGQAGLAASHELDAARASSTSCSSAAASARRWRDRWDSFCLVTPNWTVQLPGGRYDGDDPDGYMPRDDVVALPRALRRRLRAPVREGVE